jgi:DNA-binding response OmpR family regulator
MNTRILIIEDEPAIALGLRDDLELEGYQVEIADDGKAGMLKACNESFDLLLLDVSLPGMNGYDVCRVLRGKKPDLPIIMLTARSHEAEKVLGLELGADDYVTKPFSPLELRARIKAQLRRSQSSQVLSYTFSTLQVNFDRMEVLEGKSPIELTTLEFKLLKTLIQSVGRVLSRDQILDSVWGTNAVVTDRVIDTHIANLRKKLEPNGAKHISSIRGMGYRFDP